MAAWRIGSNVMITVVTVISTIIYCSQNKNAKKTKQFRKSQRFSKHNNTISQDLQINGTARSSPRLQPSIEGISQGLNSAWARLRSKSSHVGLCQKEKLIIYKRANSIRKKRTKRTMKFFQKQNHETMKFFIARSSSSLRGNLSARVLWRRDLPVECGSRWSRSCGAVCTGPRAARDESGELICCAFSVAFFHVFLESSCSCALFLE